MEGQRERLPLAEHARTILSGSREVGKIVLFINWPNTQKKIAMDLTRLQRLTNNQEEDTKAYKNMEKCQLEASEFNPE